MQLTLSDKKEVAEGTMAFWFTPEEPLDFKAGQCADFTLEDPQHTDEGGNTRTFSLANAPGEESVMIATRMRDSGFKRSLKEAETGTRVELTGPMGDFTLHKDSARPAVFLAGGIGITPVRSIVAQAVKKGLPHEITVLYSNRTRAQAAFLGEFEDWGRESKKLHFIPTLTDEAPEDWAYERGKIDGAMLSRHVSNPQKAVYYVVGPPGMVAAMKKVLDGVGIDELQVRSEDFAGY